MDAPAMTSYLKTVHIQDSGVTHPFQHCSMVKLSHTGPLSVGCCTMSVTLSNSYSLAMHSR